MLKVSSNAAAALAAARSDQGAPDTHGVRFFTSPSVETPDQTRLAFDFVPSPQPDDAVAEHSGLSTYVAPDFEAAVGDATVDTEQVGNEVHLVLRRGEEGGPTQ
jgi:hypothetical protein